MLALHDEFLSRRYLLDRLKLMEGLVGFGLGIFCVLRAFASSDPCVLESRSKDSYFLTKSWSS